MRRAVRHLILSLFIMLAWGTGWLMLWTLSFTLPTTASRRCCFCRRAFIWRC
jgi:two-component system sensor histidine kinase UhpB